MGYVQLAIFVIGAFWCLYSIFFTDTKETGKVRRLMIEQDLLLLVICIYITLQLIAKLFNVSI